MVWELAIISRTENRLKESLIFRGTISQMLTVIKAHDKGNTDLDKYRFKYSLKEII